MPLANLASQIDTPMNSASDTTNPTTVEPPNFATEVVAAVVAKNFKLSGEYTQLVSERDQNFRLRTSGGQEFVVKITGLSEDRIATDFQIAMLCHFEERQFNYAPRVFRTVSGEKRGTITSESGQEYSLRVVTWLDGTLLNNVELTTHHTNRFGQRLAELDLSLESFQFDGDGQAGLWNMQEALQLRSLLPHVNDAKVQKYTRSVLDRFDDTVLAALHALPRQTIHNDANPENILIDADGDVSGFIDFGDALKAPRIIEVATAASYLRSGDDNPLKFIEAFVEGYHQRSPLSDAEFEILFDLIRTRLAMTLIILYWRLTARDEDDPYRRKTLENESNAFEFLVFLSDLGRDAFNRCIKRFARNSHP
jgi:Ser/Thr protein kinase RdoA (MazF antagonist)